MPDDIYISPNGFVFLRQGSTETPERLFNPAELCRALGILRLTEDLRKMKKEDES